MSTIRKKFERIVILPTYGEKENLKWLLLDLLKLEIEIDILIVDDFSNDGTNDLVLDLQTKYPQLLFISRTNGKSYANSLLEGLRYAVSNNYKEILQMDADGSHNTSDLLKILNTDGDLIIGSRYLKGSRIVGVPLNRRIYSLLGNLFISILWKITIRDKTNSFRLYRNDILGNIIHENFMSLEYSVQFEILNKIIQNTRHTRIVEVPIEFKYRILGDSKFDKAKLFEALKLAFKIR